MNISSSSSQETTSVCCVTSNTGWNQLATLDGLLAALVFVSVVALVLALWICWQRCSPPLGARQKVSKSGTNVAIGTASTSSTSSSSGLSLRQPITTQMSHPSTSNSVGWMQGPNRALVANPWHPPDALSPKPSSAEMRRDFVPILQSIRESPEQRCYGNRLLKARPRSDSSRHTDTRYCSNSESQTPTILPGKYRRVENPLYITPSSEVNVVTQQWSPDGARSSSSNDSSVEIAIPTPSRHMSHSFPDLLLMTRGDTSPYHLTWVSPDKQVTSAAGTGEAAVHWRQRSYSEPVLWPPQVGLLGLRKAEDTATVTASGYKKAICTTGRRARERSRIASASGKKRSLRVNRLPAATGHRLKPPVQKRQRTRRNRPGYRGVSKTGDGAKASRSHSRQHSGPSLDFRTTSTSEFHIRTVMMDDGTPCANDVIQLSTSSSSSTCDCCRPAVTTCSTTAAVITAGTDSRQCRANYVYPRPSYSSDVILQDYGPIGMTSARQEASWSSRESSSSLNSPPEMRVNDLHCSSTSSRRRYQAPSSMSAVMGSDTTASGSTRSAATTAAIVNVSSRSSRPTSLPPFLDTPAPSTAQVVAGVSGDSSNVWLDGHTRQRDVRRTCYQFGSREHVPSNVLMATKRLANASGRRTMSVTAVHQVTSDIPMTISSRPHHLSPQTLPSTSVKAPDTSRPSSRRPGTKAGQSRSNSVKEESPLWDNFPFWLTIGVGSERQGISDDLEAEEEGRRRRASSTAAVLEWDDSDDVFVNKNTSANVIEPDDLITTQFWV